MSLALDSIFVSAISSNSDLMKVLGYVEETESDTGIPARLYGTAIPLPDEDAENVPVPYIIVTFNGLNNQTGTKDDVYESQYDQVNIGIEIAAKTLNGLHDLTQTVRDTILSYLRGHETSIEDYTLSADAIQYDADKPCYWQVLRYQCEVFNLIEEEEEENE